jgi:hypothetical protein
MCGKINTLNGQKSDFLCSIHFTLLGQIEENYINKCNSIKVCNFYIRGYHCDHSPWELLEPIFTFEYQL